MNALSMFELDLTDFSTILILTTTTILLIILTVWIISLLSASHRTEIFKKVSDAMKSISLGDYNIELDSQLKHTEHHPFGKFVKGINDMAIELKELEGMRQEFISNVSHEIQSPLASISGFAKVLKRSELTVEERERYLSIIETESLRLAHLSENLLKLTTIESDRYPFEGKVYRLDQQIRKVILSCEPQWVAKSLQLEVSLDEVDVFADEELMSQVWINLLTNAIKFTPEDGLMQIKLRNGMDALEVEIADSGIGIKEENLEFIFERFYKVDKSRNRSIGGSGLGLSIVKKIIDMHKGSINVSSKLDEGTLFTICLPIVDSLTKEVRK
jgi:signal transduction histidine kinase